MYVIGILLYIGAFLYAVYKMVECDSRAKYIEKHGKKEIEPDYKFSIIVREEEPEQELISEPYIPDEEEAKGPSSDELATEWIKDHADLIVNLTEPSYEVKQILIKKEYLNKLTAEVKDKIILKLLEIYPLEISRLGVDKEGNIIGTTNV